MSDNVRPSHKIVLIPQLSTLGGSADGGLAVVTISTNGQQFSPQGVGFTYVPEVTISSISPSRGEAEAGALNPHPT